MESIKIFNTCIIWTRSTVLILSIIIVILSLSVYNYNAIPVFLLLEEELDKNSMILKGHQIIYDMIQDRKLIATLVAAQASIFCPLFLLMSNTATTTIENLKRTQILTTERWRTFTEQFCQFLMPLGLALSWIFCITFDKRTESTLLIENMLLQENQSYYCELANYIGYHLKYIIITVLLLEVIIIWISSIKYVFTTQNKIKLLEEEEQDYYYYYYTHLGYKDEEEYL